jgi:hypothetical protein
MTGDRITEVRGLIARFPDRGEYQISTSEFKDIKTRLLAASASSRIGNSRDHGRPTLKRRPQTNPDDDPSASDSPNRPVLRRRDSSDDPQTDKPESSDDNGRPVLKRRDGSTATDSSTSPDPSSDSSGRPTLRRRPDSPDQPTSNP